MIKQIHSYWAYITVIILVFTMINAFIGFTKNKQFTHKDLRLGLFTLIATHIQLLIGLSWYFMSPWFKVLKEQTSESMKNPQIRLLSIEHPITMILAVILITVGWSKHKKQTNSTAKFKTFLIFYGIALLLMLIRIPWYNWFRNL